MLRVDGSNIKLDPLQTADLGALLPLYRQKIVRISIREASLSIEFEAGARLEVGFDPRYELWHISDETTKAALHCLPGGGLG